MSQWFLSYDGKQLGPFSVAEARAHTVQNKQGYAWREGFPEWIPISQVGELTASSAPISAPPPIGSHSDEIDYKILGSEMQFVEIDLDPGESCLAEAGSMMYKDPSVVMEAIFDTGAQGAGFVDKLLGAGKRVLTGESLFMTQFLNQGSRKAKAAFAAPYPGNIIPVHLRSMGGALICQKDSFLCAARGVSIGIYFQKKILTGLFGGEGFIMQKLEGDGLACIHAGGTLVERKLQAGEVLHVDTGCVVAFQPSVSMDIEQAGNIKTLLFGGEGVFFATLRGPGNVWMQSLPFSRLAGRMLAASVGGKEEGSVLGQLGSVLQGDR
jgi:uncharacterized protein (TIGR00266 family)